MMAENMRNAYYTIIIAQDQKYPFNGLKPKDFIVKVQKILHLFNEQKINRIVETFSKVKREDHHNVIKIQSIKHSSFLDPSLKIGYEYVPYALTLQDEKIRQLVKSIQFHQTLVSLFFFLMKNGINPCLEIDNYGFTEDYVLKYFLNCNFASFNSKNIKQERALVEKKASQFQKLLIQSHMMETSSSMVRNSQFKIGKKESIEILPHNYKKLNDKNSSTLKKPPSLSEIVGDQVFLNEEQGERKKIRKKRFASFEEQKTIPECDGWMKMVSSGFIERTCLPDKVIQSLTKSRKVLTSMKKQNNEKPDP